jgi:hypothetical protein
MINIHNLLPFTDLLRGFSRATALALLLLLSCHGTDTRIIDPKRIPGTYVMTGPSFTDEIVLREDGTLVRRAVHAGQTWTQTGRWNWQTMKSRPASNTVLEFTALEPECSIDEAPASKPFPWAATETPLCARSKFAYFCYDRERLSLCFDENVSYRYHRRWSFLGWFTL